MKSVFNQLSRLLAAKYPKVMETATHRWHYNRATDVYIKRGPYAGQTRDGEVGQDIYRTVVAEKVGKDQYNVFEKEYSAIHWNRGDEVEQKRKLLDLQGRSVLTKAEALGLLADREKMMSRGETTQKNARRHYSRYTP